MIMIQYINLYKYLISEEHLSTRAALRNILRIRKLPIEYKNAVLDIINGYIPNISTHGVSLDELINKDGMTPIRAILFLDWVNREPANAFKYMSEDTIRDSHPSLSEEIEKELDSDIERLRLMVENSQIKKIDNEVNPEELKDLSDIK